MRIPLTTRFVALGVGICFGVASVASAQTFVCGNISGTWSPSGNPYIATCDCTVPAGQTLTIQPGVLVEIGSGLSIINNGLIQAVGNPTQRITFQAPVSSQYWNTILNNYSGGTNLFTYCDFQNATTALSMSVIGGNSTMVTEILNCTFSNCVLQGVYGSAQGYADLFSSANATLTPTIKDCTFSTSSNGCVLLIYGGAVPTQGTYGYGYAYPTICANIFQNLTGSAFLMTLGNYAGAGGTTFLNNTIVDCRAGVNAIDPWDALIQDNIFFGCTNAVMDSGSLSRQVSYNDFYGNATNFTGYNTNIYGKIIWNNRNGTPADVLYNIYSNPLFVATNDFHLTTSSPCVNAGTPNTAFANMCFPPSIATNFPDLGAYGGPDACNWLTNVPELPAQLSLTKSNSFIWLNWGAIPRSTYLVQYVATNLIAAPGTNKWLTNTTVIPANKPVSIAVSPYPTTNNKVFYRVRSLGRTPGN